MSEGIFEGYRKQAPSLSGESPSLQGPRSWDLTLGQVSLPYRLGSPVSSLPGGYANWTSGDFTQNIVSLYNHAGLSEMALAPGWKVWHPQDPLVLPPFCSCPGSWVLISADAPCLKTHIWHPLAKHSTKTGHQSICMSSGAGGEYLTLLFINNSLALTCLNKSSNKVKCRSQRLTNMKMCTLTVSPPDPAGSPNLPG